MIFLKVTDTGNIHLRVGDFLMDVYGFNITYEIVDINTNLRTDACSVYKCSFLGKIVDTEHVFSRLCMGGARACLLVYWG